MQHIEHRLNTLKRPKLMLEAARNRTARYDPNRHLPVLLGGSYHKSKTGQLDCLLDTEEIYTDCAKKSAPSIPRRATSFTSLLYCQNMAAQKTPKSRAHALDKSVRHGSFFVGHIFLKRGQYLGIERRLPIAVQLMGHAFCG